MFAVRWWNHKAALAVTFLLLSLTAWAQDVTSADVASAPVSTLAQPVAPSPYSARSLSTPENTIRALARTISPLVTTLTRPIYAYHYRERRAGETSYVAPDSAEWALQINLEIQDSVWNPDLTVPALNNGSFFGAGLYLAENPFVSRTYGGSGMNWLLLQMRFPTGAKLLDLAANSADQIYLLPQIRAALSRHFGCRVQKVRDIFEVNAQYSQRCFEVRRALVHELDVIAFAYGWWGSGPSPAVCPGLGRNAAFYMTSEYAVEDEDIRIFVHTPTPPSGTPDAFDSDRRMIDSIFEQNGLGSFRRWPGLTNLYDQASVRAHMLLHSRGCNRDYVEDFNESNAQLTRTRLTLEGRAWNQFVVDASSGLGVSAAWSREAPNDESARLACEAQSASYIREAWDRTASEDRAAMGFEGWETSDGLDTFSFECWERYLPARARERSRFLQAHPDITTALASGFLSDLSWSRAILSDVGTTRVSCDAQEYIERCSGELQSSLAQARGALSAADSQAIRELVFFSDTASGILALIGSNQCNSIQSRCRGEVSSLNDVASSVAAVIQAALAQNPVWAYPFARTYWSGEYMAACGRNALTSAVSQAALAQMPTLPWAGSTRVTPASPEEVFRYSIPLACLRIRDEIARQLDARNHERQRVHRELALRHYYHDGLVALFLASNGAAEWILADLPPVREASARYTTEATTTAQLTHQTWLPDDRFAESVPYWVPQAAIRAARQDATLVENAALPLFRPDVTSAYASVLARPTPERQTFLESWTRTWVSSHRGEIFVNDLSTSPFASRDIGWLAPRLVAQVESWRNEEQAGLRSFAREHLTGAVALLDASGASERVARCMRDAMGALRSSAGSEMPRLVFQDEPEASEVVWRVLCPALRASATERLADRAEQVLLGLILPEVRLCARVARGDSAPAIAARRGCVETNLLWDQWQERFISESLQNRPELEREFGMAFDSLVPYLREHRADAIREAMLDAVEFLAHSRVRSSRRR